MSGWGGDHEQEPSPAALLRSKNLLNQAALVSRWLSKRATQSPILWPGLIRRLHSVVCHGQEEDAPGQFRVLDTCIEHVRDFPPWQEVRPLVNSLCDDVNSQIPQATGAALMQTALELGAYTLWRVNWVHPFNDGNGRTARAAAYLVICCVIGAEIPGRRHVTDYMMTSGQWAYLDGLNHAHRHWDNEQKVETLPLQELLSEALIAQLESR